MVKSFISNARINVVMLVSLALTSCGTVSVKEYPHEWPPLTGMSTTCTEVSGTYVDSNSWRWEYVDPQNGSKHNGTLEAAWPVFAFNAATVRPSDQSVKSRAFSIAFGDDSSLIIYYLLDNKAVESRTYSKTQWICGKEGINLITLEKTGIVMDKLPNHGTSMRTAIINRTGDNLYVKVSDTTSAWLFHVIPEESKNVRWFRFPVQSQ